MQEKTYSEMVIKSLVCFFIILTHFGGVNEASLQSCRI